MDAIMRRASVRHYTDELVSDEQVELILRAAMAAPSAGNQRPWEFYVVRDAGVRAALAQAALYSGPCGRAPVVIVPCLTEARFAGEAPQDISAAVENAWLEATDLGLGAVWMSVWPHEDRIANVRAALRVSAELTPFALFAVGHPANEPQAEGPNRYDASRVRWI